jgi:hypothetical protein
MMILSYLIGQKYFPINYNLKKFFGYLGLAVLLYAISALIPIHTLFPRIAFHTLLLLTFAAIALRLEKIRLSNIFS